MAKNTRIRRDETITDGVPASETKSMEVLRVRRDNHPNFHPGSIMALGATFETDPPREHLALKQAMVAEKSPLNTKDFKPDMPKTIDRDALYRVQLHKPVRFAGTILRPDQVVTLRGSVIEDDEEVRNGIAIVRSA